MSCFGGIGGCLGVATQRTPWKATAPIPEDRQRPRDHCSYSKGTTKGVKRILHFEDEVLCKGRDRSHCDPIARNIFDHWMDEQCIDEMGKVICEGGIPTVFEANIDEYYDVGEKIGQGGSGIVFKATRICDGQQHALKFIETSNIRDEQARDLIEELMIMGHCSHENIVKMHQLFHWNDEEDKAIVIAMELMATDLLHHIQQVGVFNDSDAALAMIHVANGLQYLKELNISHRSLSRMHMRRLTLPCYRDIKPGHQLLHLHPNI